MSDNIRQEGVSRKAGRGFLRTLKSLFGDRPLKKAGASWRALKEEFRAGSEEAEAKEPSPRGIPYREVGSKRVEPTSEGGRESPESDS